MKKFQIGAKYMIADFSGIDSRKIVTVIRNFDWQEADDGTYCAPDKSQVPIRFPDGQRGFMFANRLIQTKFGDKHPDKLELWMTADKNSRLDLLLKMIDTTQIIVAPATVGRVNVYITPDLLKQLKELEKINEKVI